MKLSLLALNSLALALQVVLLTSDRTPFDMSRVRASLSDISDLTISSLSVAKAPALLTEPQAEVVLDYSYSRDISLRLLAISTESLVICMYVNCPSEEVRGRLHPVEVASNVTAYLQAVGFPHLFLAASASPFYQEILHYMATETTLSLTSVVSMKEDLDKEAVEMLVGHVLKPAGSAVATFLVDEETGLHLYPALQKYHIAKKGYAYFLSDEAVWNTKLQGALYVTDSAAVKAQSRLEYELLILEDQLRQLGRVTALETTELRREFAVTSRPLTMSLVNLRDGVPVLVGTSPASLKSILLPGNTTEVPIAREQIIPVTADFTGLNWDGSTYPSGYIITRGIQVGYADINNRKDLVPNFRFVNYTAGLGGEQWNKTFALSQLKALREPIGIAFNGFGFSGTIMGIHNLFQEQNLSIPITALATNPLLSDPVTFPMFLRTYSSGKHSALVLLKFFQLWGWKRVAFISSSGSGNAAFYEVFKDYTKYYGVEIVNNETNRILPLTLTPESEEQMNRTISEIIHSTVRIVILAHTNGNKIVERMYDLGVRAGDYLICMQYGMTLAQYNTSQRREPLQGAMMFYDRYFAGSEGERIKQLLIQADGDLYDSMGCMHYDNVLLVAHAVDFMLARGLLFEDGRELIKVMRETHFVGCNGIIQIEHGTNDRIPGDYSVLNAVVGPNSSLTLTDAAFYTPGKTQLFTILPSLQFPDGSNSGFADSWPEHPKCPYLLKLIANFQQGITLGIAVNFGFAGLSSVTVLATYKWWHILTFQPLLEKNPLSWEDSLALFTVPIEFVQVLALGPDLNITSTLTSIGRLSLLHVEEFVNVSQGVFWVVETVVCVWVFVFTVQCAGQLSNKMHCHSEIAFWWNLMVPTLVKVMFLPTCFTLLSTFECQQATGASYAESFLDRDCYERCWSRSHLSYAVTSAVCLCVYIPLNGVMQPRWQAEQSSLHIRYLSLDLMVKFTFQTTLVAAYVSLRSMLPAVHAGVYLCLMAFYTLFVFMTKGYNYQRMNLWRQLLTLALLGYAGLGLAQVNGLERQVSLIIWATVCGALLGAGLLIQALIPRYCSFLIRLKDDRYDIILFAFTFGQHSQVHLRHFNEKRAASRYSSAIPDQEVGWAQSHNNLLV